MCGEMGNPDGEKEMYCIYFPVVCNQEGAKFHTPNESNQPIAKYDFPIEGVVPCPLVVTASVPAPRILGAWKTFVRGGTVLAQVQCVQEAGNKKNASGPLRYVQLSRLAYSSRTDNKLGVFLH